jgi:hypothetical protein
LEKAIARQLSPFRNFGARFIQENSEMANDMAEAAYQSEDDHDRTGILREEIADMKRRLDVFNGLCRSP